MAEIHNQAERDYLLGMKYKDIAEKYGVTINTVKSWKQRHGWQRGTKNSAPKVKEQVHTKTKTKRVQNAPVIIQEETEDLTEKQKLFCLYYMKNKNASMSVIKAGYEVSNSQRAAEIGYQLLHSPPVKKEYDRLRELKRLSIMLDPDDIVERYMQIAFSDMTDVAKWGTELVPARDDAGYILIGNDGNMVYRKQSYMDFKDHDQVDGGLICEISMGRQGMKVKLEDRQKALNWLSDYFNMNPMNQHKMQYDKQKIQIDKDSLALRKEAEDKNW